MGLFDVTGRVMDIQAMQQASDIKASENVGIYGFLREKKYVKDKDMAFSTNPRLLPFPEPYQVATSITRVPWNITNYACLVQLDSCNLSCDYCFCGETKSMEVSVQEVFENYWDKYVLKCDKYPTPVFRISGGEPFLQQHFLSSLVRVMRRTKRLSDCIVGNTGLYFWIDTNLTVEPEQDLLDSLAYENVGVCGCFKPVSAPSAFYEQCHTAIQLIDAGIDTYFYYPCSLTESEKQEVFTTEWGNLCSDYIERWREEFVEHLHAASSIIGEYYPCRVHPIKIGYDYGAVGGSKLQSDISAIKQDCLFSVLRDYIEHYLGPMYYWLPDYQVDIRNGVVA